MVGGELLAASGHDVAIDVPDQADNPAGPLGEQERDDGSHIGGGTDQPDRWKSLNVARAWSTSAGGSVAELLMPSGWAAFAGEVEQVP